MIWIRLMNNEKGMVGVGSHSASETWEIRDGRLWVKERLDSHAEDMKEG
jgi:hypothetical protein